MRRMLTLATAATVLVGAVAASGPAAAQRYRRDRDNHGDAVAAGVLGLALGAAIGSANNNRGYNSGYYAPRGYSSGYYGGGYYGGGGYYAPPARAYGYGYGPPRRSRCVVERRWDPYYGRNVRYERCW